MLGLVLLLGGVALGQQTYTIKPGDNLTKIARKHHCTVEALAKANSLKPDTVIHPGQKLKIPGKPEPAAIRTAPAPAPATHTIEPGETFSSVSRRYNIPLEDLLAANPKMDPRTLRPGQKIQLTSRREAAATTAATSASGTSIAKPEVETTEAQSPPSDDTPAAEPAEGKIISVAVDAEITYGEFAAKHGTDVVRLNELNGLHLTSSILLAKGSVLYVPQKPPAGDTDP